MRTHVVTLAATALLALPVAAPVARATTPALLPPAAAVVRPEPREVHPEIREAIRSLERAKVALEHANHDFGGHRTDAIRSVDESIRQLKLALQYDRK